MTGIAHGLILDAQQKIADEFKADPDSMRKLRNKHRELTKRRKKNITMKTQIVRILNMYDDRCETEKDMTVCPACIHKFGRCYTS